MYYHFERNENKKQMLLVILSDFPYIYIYIYKFVHCLGWCHMMTPVIGRLFHYLCLNIPNDSQYF